MPVQRSLKRGRRRERAHQYRVMAERLQFHLDRENLSSDVADRVRTAKDALLSAAQLMDESAQGSTGDAARETV